MKLSDLPKSGRGRIWNDSTQTLSNLQTFFKTHKMRHYPIWVKTTNCNYTKSPSYGFKDTGETEYRVGSSASNSHHFVDTKITRRSKIDPETGETAIIFTFYVDDLKIKRRWFKTDSKGRATEPYREENFITVKQKS